MSEADKTILLVEDDAAHAESVRRAFEGNRFALAVADSLNAARDYLARARPDLVIVDLRLPDGRGLDLLRDDDGGLPCPVVVMTDQGDDEAVVQAMKAGALDCLARSDRLWDDLPRLAERALREWDHIGRRRRAEEALRSSEERFRLLYDRAPLGYQSLDEDGHFIEVNQAWLDTLGYAREEVIGRNFSEFIHPDGVEQFRERFPRFKAAERIAGVEFEMVKKDGSLVTVSFDGRIGFDDAGRFKQTHCILHDVTERKRGEQALAEKERYYRTLIQSIHEDILVLDRDYRILDVNDAFLNSVGRPRDEVVGRRCYEISHEHDVPCHEHGERCSLQEVFRTGRPCSHSHVHRSDDGSSRVVDILISPLEDESGEVTRVIEAIRDVTDLKRTQEALERTEERYRLLFNQSDDAIFVHGLEDDGRPGQFLEVNNVACQRLGYSREEFLELSPLDIGVETDPDEAKAIGKRLLAQGRAEFATTHRTKNGRLIPVESNVRLFDLQGQRAVLSVSRDITDRQQAEQALRESEHRLRITFDEAPIGAAITDPNDFRFIRSNREFCRFLGYTEAELRGLSFRDITHPEDQETDAEFIQRLIQGELDQYAREKRYLRKDGREVWGRLSVSLVRDDAGSPLYFIPMVEDITDRKRAEEAFKESEHRLRELVTYMSSGVAVYEAVDDGLDFVFRDFNQAAERITGVDKKDLLGRSVREVFPGVTDLGLFEVFRRVFETGRPERHPEAVYADERLEFWTDNYVYRLPSGEIVAVFDDITEQKRAEEALRESERALQTLMANLPGMAYRCLNDQDWTMLFVSDGCRELTGYHPEDLVDSRGLSYNDLIDPRDRQAVWNQIQEAVSRREPFAVMYRLRTAAGEVKWVWENGEGVFQEDGHLVALEGFVSDITELRQAEDALRDSEKRLKEAQKIGRIGHWEYGVEGREIIWSDQMFKLMERDPATGPPTSLEDVLNLFHPESSDLFESALLRAIQNSRRQELELHVKLPGGGEAYHHAIIDPQLDAARRVIRLQGTAQDVTARRRAEMEREQAEIQLLQSQKMEAVGRLAGGIAHDFNNLLTIITGFSDLALERLSAIDPLYQDLMEVSTAGRRAAALTKQLLAFSRRQVLEPRVIDVNTIVDDVEKMLQRLIGEDIELVVATDPDAGTVKADPGQLEQVIMNLAVNARDAMPRGGRLTVETANVLVDDSFAEEHVEMTPGPHVMLAVSDTGVGMDKEVSSRIFEPFFTTKAVGKGTGLGLSTVYGIVRQSDGHIFVYSEPGRGSTFKIYLPRLDKAVKETGPALEDDESFRGSETILVVEDEDQVRELTDRVLRRYGYEVLQANNGAEAMAVCESHPGPIHLLITDVVMPQMSGQQVAERIGELRPEMKVLFMSGYTDDAIAHYGVINEGVNFISKPFSPNALARKVREILEGRPGGAGPPSPHSG